MTIEPYFHVKDDAYCYPDSNVLRNMLGITDYDELVSAEGRLTVIAMIQMDSEPVRGCFGPSQDHPPPYLQGHLRLGRRIQNGGDIQRDPVLLLC